MNFHIASEVFVWWKLSKNGFSVRHVFLNTVGDSKRLFDQILHRILIRESDVATKTCSLSAPPNSALLHTTFKSLDTIYYEPFNYSTYQNHTFIILFIYFLSTAHHCLFCCSNYNCTTQMKISNCG